MRLIYRLSDRNFISFGTHDVAGDGQGKIEVTDKTIIENIQNGYIVTIDANLKITTSPPEKTITDLAVANLKEATTKTAQQDKLIKLLLIERGITPK